jgi:hypothetical protein
VQQTADRLQEDNARLVARLEQRGMEVLAHQQQLEVGPKRSSCQQQQQKW